jgi:hypothetical protein
MEQRMLFLFNQGHLLPAADVQFTEVLTDLRLENCGRASDWVSTLAVGWQPFARRQSLPSMQSLPNSFSDGSDYCIPNRGCVNQ